MPDPAGFRASAGTKQRPCFYGVEEANKHTNRLVREIKLDHRRQMGWKRLLQSSAGPTSHREVPVPGLWLLSVSVVFSAERADDAKALR